MAAIYEVGKIDPNDPDDEQRFKELFNSTPKRKLYFRPVPTSYKVASAADIIPDEVRDDLIQKSKDAPDYVRYCRACWPVVRDLQVFSFEQDGARARSAEYIAWNVRLDELSTSPDWGRMSSAPLGCCAAADS